MADTFDPADLRLLLDVRRDDDALVLEYTLHNDSDLELAVLSRIPGKSKDGKPNLDPHNAYLDIEPEPEPEPPALSVRKAILPVPEGLSVAEKVIPAATRLAPHSSFAETLRWPLPLPLYHPYRAALLRLDASPGSRVLPTLSRPVQAITLNVGVVPLLPPTRLVSAGSPDVFQVVPPHAAFAGQVVVSAQQKLDDPIDVLDYEVIAPPAAPPTP